jgi:transcriptional regulator with XRE-family HTH domain
VRLFELIRKKSGKTIPQFARALGFERQHWHRLESGLVQGKLLRTFALAVVEAGLSGEEVLEMLRGVAAESRGGIPPSIASHPVGPCPSGGSQ